MEPRRTVETEDRIGLAHIDVNVRVVVRRGRADALEFPDPDADFRDSVVVPEFWAAAAGHRSSLVRGQADAVVAPRHRF